MLDRRRLLTTTAASLIAGAARAGDEDIRFVWRGFNVDASAVGDDRRAEVAGWIRQQIDLVESLRIRDDVKTWFRSVSITVDPALNQPGAFRDGRLTMDDAVSPPENPVLLHELLHGYQPRLPGGLHDPHLIAAFRAARTSGDWPANAYMFTNPAEFFAMTGSVLLWGRAARPPFTRARLVETAPDYAAWLAEVFGLTM